MIWIIILVVSVVLIALITNWAENNDKDGISAFRCSAISLLSCLALCSIMTILEKDKPTALDVYRSKTTLEITYRDSVAVDSVVVYKMK